jgi:MFS family permease
MLQKLIERFVGHRHFWRNVGLNELSEIYANQLLRSLALNIIGIFVPIYLYKLGFSIQDILLQFFAVLFATHLVFDVISAHIVARYGPKHSLALSAVIQVAYLCLLVTTQDLRWPIWVLAIVAAIANSLFFLSLHTDFSKIKHADHVGKELGFLWSFDRLGAALGPLVGGLLANYFDPRYAIVASIVALIASLLPLFATAEPVRTNQKITFKGLKYQQQGRNYAAHAAFELDNIASIAIWPLYVGVGLFATNTYAKLGIAVSISTGVALLAAWSIGKIVDSAKSRSLYNGAVAVNAVIHGLRIFPTNLFGVVALNIINDPTTASFRMPYTKALYDAADEQEGYRIAYITSTMLVGSLAKGGYCLTLWWLMHFYQPIHILKWHFPVVGALTLYMLIQQYRALR